MVGEKTSSVREVTEFEIDVGGAKRKIAAYVVPSTYEFDIILGKTWLEDVDGVVYAAEHRLDLRRYQISVRSREGTPALQLDCAAITAAAFQLHVRKSKKQKLIQVFAASLKDIEKALRPKTVLTIDEVQQAFPPYLRKYAQLFTPKEGEELPPVCGPDVDHQIELIPQDGKLLEVLYGPLYSMS